MKNPKCLRAKLSVLIIWQRLVLACGAPESFSTNLMQKHQLFNPGALESRDRLPTFFFFIPFFLLILNWNVGGLVRWLPENLHSNANPQLRCYLFNMRHDNKACEMRMSLPWLRRVARHVQVDWKDANNRRRPRTRAGVMSADGKVNVGSQRQS